VLDMTTPEAPLRLALIIGSTRDGRFATTVADWFAAVVTERDDFDLDVIDLAALDLPPVWTRDTLPSIVEWRERLAAADAFVVVTPEYNHSYPAALKQAIDLNAGEFARKPVAFVSYGGLSGGLRAVEHLRAVFAEARATTIRETVSFHGTITNFDADGWPLDPAAGEAALVLLDDLAWWASTLRAGRLVDAASAA
jgi:NAD(P)H-dependent FMN reductase